MRRLMILCTVLLFTVAQYADKRIAKMEYEIFVNGLSKGREKVRVDVDKRDNIVLTSSDLFYKLPYPQSKRQYIELFIYPEFRKTLDNGTLDSYAYRMKINDFSDMDLVEADQSAQEMIDQNRPAMDWSSQMNQQTDNIMRDHIDFGVTAGLVRNAGKSLHFMTTKSMITRAKDEPIKGPVAVLDPMTVTIYPFLLDQLKGDGPVWDFWFAIPQYLKYRAGSVELQGIVEMSIGGKNYLLKHYDVKVDGGIFSSFWVDRAGRIVEVSMPRDGFVSILQETEYQPFDKAAPVMRQESVTSRVALNETKMTLASDGVTIGGTFTAPEGAGPFPAVLLLQDLGTTDRDGNVLGGGGVSPLRQLAYLLAEEGIATLRVDARGIGQSGGEPEKLLLASREKDIASLAAWLRANPAVKGDQLFVYASGLSGWVALRAEQAVRPAGFLLAAYPAKPLLRLFREQTVVLSDPSANAKATKELLVLEEQLRSEEEWGSFRGSRQYLPAMRELAALDPLGLLKVSTVPALLAYPEKDEIVLPFHKDIAAVACHANQEAIFLPDTEHSLLRDDPKSGVSGVLDRAAIKALASWLLKRSGGS